jgi:hypothetical protein
VAAGEDRRKQQERRLVAARAETDALIAIGRSRLDPDVDKRVAGMKRSIVETLSADPSTILAELRRDMSFGGAISALFAEFPDIAGTLYQRSRNRSLVWHILDMMSPGRCRKTAPGRSEPREVRRGAEISAAAFAIQFGHADDDEVSRRLGTMGERRRQVFAVLTQDVDVTLRLVNTNPATARTAACTLAVDFPLVQALERHALQLVAAVLAYVPDVTERIESKRKIYDHVRTHRAALPESLRKSPRRISSIGARLATMPDVVDVLREIAPEVMEIFDAASPGRANRGRRSGPQRAAEANTAGTATRPGRSEARSANATAVVRPLAGSPRRPAPPAPATRPGWARLGWQDRT